MIRRGRCAPRTGKIAAPVPSAPVPTVARRLLAAVELARLPIAFGAVANVWLMILLARGDERLADTPAATIPLWQALASGALLAVGFMVFGAALNDFLDAKHDRAFAPSRPIAAGMIAPRRAMQLAVAALCTGLLGAIPFGEGALLAAMGLATIVLVYDAFAKHVPAFGIVLAGLATLVSMLAPCVECTQALPVWLAMSQTMGVGALAYVLAEKRPRLTRRAVAIGATGWIFWSLALAALQWWRNDGDFLRGFPDARILAIPAGTVLVCAGVGVAKLRGVRGPRATEKLLRYGSLWKSLVAAAWLVAAGQPEAAAWIGGIALAIFGLVALLRETGPQLAEPTGWRS
jgi:4-hydroxybenzoate polyprenyltransferase